jgi:hypothetical protein
MSLMQIDLLTVGFDTFLGFDTPLRGYSTFGTTQPTGYIRNGSALYDYPTFGTTQPTGYIRNGSAL